MGEEVKKKEIQQLLAGYMELKSKREHERVLLNEVKIDVQWRELMREAKSKDLQRDLALMKLAFIKSADYKDAVISSLQKQLEQVEVQNMWAACNHMKAVDKLIGIEHQRSEKLRQIYEKDLDDLKKYYMDTKEEMRSQFRKEETWYEDIEFVEKTVFKNFEEKTNMEFLLKEKHLDDEVEKERTEIEQSFDCSILNIWKSFQSVLVKYMEDAEAMENLFVAMKAEYEGSISEIQHERNTTDDLRNSIPSLKAQIEERERSHKERIAKILLEQEDFCASAGDLMKKIAKQEKQDDDLLLHLVINSNEALQELQKLVSKGEKIVKLHERCEKLEAEIGGIPPDVPLLSNEELEEAKKGMDFALPSSLQGAEGCQYLSCLENLWKRHNKIVLQNFALKKELSELELDNLRLKSDVGRVIQTLSKKGNKYQIASSRVLKPSPPVVQDAALLMKMYPGSKTKKF